MWVVFLSIFRRLIRILQYLLLLSRLHSMLPTFIIYFFSKPRDFSFVLGVSFQVKTGAGIYVTIKINTVHFIARIIRISNSSNCYFILVDLSSFGFDIGIPIKQYLFVVLYSIVLCKIHRRCLHCVLQ